MPTTRSMSKSSSSSTLGAPAQLSDTMPVKDETVTGLSLPGLDDIQDDALLHGRDVKRLRDATTSALSQVWSDTCATAALLTRKINEGNAALTEKLNDSFAAVGQRLDSLPAIAMIQPDPQTPRVSTFSGASENGVQFSIWLRRLEDIMRMRPVPLTDEQQANYLIGHLDGVAREKVEELDSDAKRSYSAVVSHLTAFFESPQQRYVARQKLSACRQEPGESCTTFANRVLHLVRAATSGQDPATQKDRVLEEFVARLRSDVRYFVKLDNPSTFEQAVTKAQTVEQLLSEATAERLLHPASTPATVQVMSRPSRKGPPQSQRQAPQGNPFRPRMAPQASPWRQQLPSQSRAPRATEEVRCYNCNGIGHFAFSCPSARRSRTSGPRSQPRVAARPPPARRNNFENGTLPRPPQGNILCCDPPVDPAQPTTGYNNSHTSITQPTRRDMPTLRQTTRTSFLICIRGLHTSIPARISLDSRKTQSPRRLHYTFIARSLRTGTWPPDSFAPFFHVDSWEIRHQPIECLFWKCLRSRTSSPSVSTQNSSPWNF
ncbi:hypothetical protein V3C99_007773 [Haemonchus contortus]